MAKPPALNRSKPDGRPRGFVCKKHLVKLHVRHRKPAAPGIVVRYLECPAPGCKFVMRTEERPAHSR